MVNDSCTVRIVIHAKWIKPWFREGYTRYTVARETIRYYAGAETYGRESLDVIFRTRDLQIAQTVKEDMIKSGVET